MIERIRLDPAEVAGALGITPDEALSLFCDGRWLAWLAKLWLREPVPGRVRVLTDNGISFCRQREIGVGRTPRPVTETQDWVKALKHVWIVDIRDAPEIEMHKLGWQQLVALLGYASRAAHISPSEFDTFMRQP